MWAKRDGCSQERRGFQIGGRDVEGVEAWEEGSGLGEGAGLVEERGLHVCQADSSGTPVFALCFLKWVSPSPHL